MKRFVKILSVAALVGLPTTISAQDKPATPKPVQAEATPKSLPLRSPQEAEQAITAALSKSFNGEFTETPLSDVAEYLAASFKINVALDGRALDNIGVASDTPVTFHGQGVSLRSALSLILDNLELEWAIRDESLIITSREAAEEHLTTRLYEVRDLVVPMGPTASMVYKGDAQNTDFDSLIDLIWSTAAPASWDQVGGPGSVSGGVFGGRHVLVVSNTEGIHQQITELLAQIRKVPAPANAKPDNAARLMVFPLSADAETKAEAITELIQKVVEPESWAKEGFSVDAAAGVIVVKQSPAAHAQIGKLLEAMGVIAPSVDYYNTPGGLGGPGFSGGGISGGGLGNSNNGGFF